MIIRRSLAGLGIGTLFGIGLCVSHMANPEKVLSFLIIGSHWDPSLLLVMGAATTVAFVGYRWAGQGQPLFDTQHFLPTLQKIDRKLVIGAAIFGVGWGLAGYCPGPAITGLSSVVLEPFVFVAAMLGGSQLARITGL